MNVQNTQDRFRMADRLPGLDLSEIVRISEHAARFRAQGVDVTVLSAGEPDFPAPDNVIAAAHRAALRSQTRYAPTAGTPALRKAIASQAGVRADNVIVSTGAKQVLANALIATLNPGDEVIVPAPFWTSYADMIRLAGGIPVILSCPVDQGFKLAPEQLETAFTSRTRWLMLSTPSNPSGAVYTLAALQALAQVLERYPQVWILSDEIYLQLSCVPFVSFADAAPNLADRTLTVNGVSKAYSMTGWRILCVSANVSESASGYEFCRFLLEEAGVVLVPGHAFGMPGQMRLSFAYATESLQEGLRRIADATSGL